MTPVYFILRFSTFRTRSNINLGYCRRSQSTLSRKMGTFNISSLPSKVQAVMQPDIQSKDLVRTELPLQLAREGTDEHLIKVYATAPCAGELLWARDYAAFMDPNRVAVPCNDLSGIVVTAPADSPFPSGTEIFTRTPAGRTGYVSRCLRRKRSMTEKDVQQRSRVYHRQDQRARR